MEWLPNWHAGGGDCLEPMRQPDLRMMLQSGLDQWILGIGVGIRPIELRLCKGLGYSSLCLGPGLLEVGVLGECLRHFAGRRIFGCC